LDPMASQSKFCGLAGNACTRAIGGGRSRARHCGSHRPMLKAAEVEGHGPHKQQKANRTNHRKIDLVTFDKEIAASDLWSYPTQVLLV